MVALYHTVLGRKVRTSKGAVQGNSLASQGDGKCNRKYVQIRLWRVL